LPLVFARVAEALGEPPHVAFAIDCAVAAVGPVVFAVVVDLGFIDNDGAGGAGVGAMGVDIVDEEQEALGVDSIDGAGAGAGREVFAAGLGAGLGDHDERFAVGELTVFDAAPFSLHTETDGEAECGAEPIDGGCRVIVVESGGEAGPALWCLLHLDIVN